jgi:hypothetical protein
MQQIHTQQVCYSVTVRNKKRRSRDRGETCNLYLFDFRMALAMVEPCSHKYEHCLEDSMLLELQ